MRIACLAVALLASTGAEARVYDGGITHAKLRALMLEAGLQAVTVDAETPEGMPRLVVVGGPARWYVELLACKDGRCGDLHLSAGYALDTEHDAAAVRDFNDSLTGWINGNVYIDDERDPIFQSDANTDGASGNSIRCAVTAFDAAVRCVSVVVGFDDTPDACKDFATRMRALQDRGLVTGSMTLPLAGGVTEDAVGMMIRSFHSWAVNFAGDMPD